jgi:polyvinyl alcohol dehydrogenase (cytochrome)
MEPVAARPDEAADKPSEWRSIGYDDASTYFNRAETKLTKENVSQLKLAWAVDLGASIYSAPLQIADRIYVSGPNDVRALDAVSGEELWRLEVQSSSTLSFNAGVLYLNTNELYVVAIDAATGTELWRRRADMQSTDGYSSVVAVDGRLLVGASSSAAELGGGKFRGYMAALDLKSGDAIWTSYTVPETANGAGIFSSPSADVAARLAFGTTSNNYGPPATDTSDAFIAFDLDTGAIKWKFQAVANDTFDFQRADGSTTQDLNFGANPVLYEAEVEGQMTKLVAAGGKSGAIYALRRADGKQLWTRQLGIGSVDGTRGVMNNTTWSGKHVLVACNERGPSTLYALDGATGDVVWQRKLAGSVWGRISVANGVGFVGNENVLEAFDVESGDLLYSHENVGTLAGVITIANGRVAFGEGLLWIAGTPGKMLTVLTIP